MKKIAGIITLAAVTAFMYGCAGNQSADTVWAHEGWSYSWEAPEFYSELNKTDTAQADASKTSVLKKNDLNSTGAQKLPSDSEIKWKPYTFNTEPPDRNERKEIWLRYKVPEHSFSDDALLIYFAFLGFETYRDGKLIFRTGRILPGGEIQFNGFPYYMISPGAGGEGKYLYFRVFSNFVKIGFKKTVWFGNRYDLLVNRLADELDKLITGVMIFIIGLVSIFIALSRSRRIDKLIFTFPVFAMSTGIWMIAASPIFILLTGFPYVYSVMGTVFQNIWILALILFHRQMFGTGPFKIVKILEYIASVHLIINSIYFIYNYFIPLSLTIFSILYPISIVILLAIIFILPFHSLSKALSGDREAQILTLAIMVLASFGFREIMGDLNIIHRDKIYYHYGVVLFILFLGYLYERRVTRTGRELLEKKMALSLAEKDLELSRLKLLQDRMNPHFLFNSLSALYALLEQKQNEKAKDASVILTEHYRYLTDLSQESLIPLSGELEFCENFLKMQKIRFGGDFSYSLDIEKGISGVKIPPLTIQPLIENSIKHGLRKRPGPGNIDVSVKSFGDGAKIEVSDNGDSLRSENLYERSLGNMKKRLGHFYEEADLVIENQSSGPGVKVIIWFQNIKNENAVNP